MGKVILILIGILLVIWILTDPIGAADFVTNLGNKLATAANSILLFLRNVV